MFSGKINMTTALTSSSFLYLQTYILLSWTIIAKYQLSSLGASCDFNMVNFIYMVGLPNTSFKLAFVNGNASAVTLSTVASASLLSVTRTA